MNTGPGRRSGTPSIEKVFDESTTPGLNQQTNVLRLGGFLQFDTRDNPGGPRRGENLIGRYTYTSDQKLDKYSYHELDLAAEK